jgi:hypothetical protein
LSEDEQHVGPIARQRFEGRVNLTAGAILNAQAYRRFPVNSIWMEAGLMPVRGPSSPRRSV